MQYALQRCTGVASAVMMNLLVAASQSVQCHADLERVSVAEFTGSQMTCCIIA